MGIVGRSNFLTNNSYYPSIASICQSPLLIHYERGIKVNASSHHFKKIVYTRVGTAQSRPRVNDTHKHAHTFESNVRLWESFLDRYNDYNPSWRLFVMTEEHKGIVRLWSKCHARRLHGLLSRPGICPRQCRVSSAFMLALDVCPIACYHLVIIT